MEEIWEFLFNIDVYSLIFFLLLWVCYSLWADNRSKDQLNLIQVMHIHRLKWVAQLLRREERLVDVRVVANLLQSTIFLASTSILIIGGLVAMLGYGQKALNVIASIPFSLPMSPEQWILKTTVLLVIFVYSFFKFTWVMRQFNYVIVLILAAPVQKDGSTDNSEFDYHESIATMLTNAAKHFNIGIRSYYYGMIALSWFINSHIFIALSIFITYIIYRREFKSATLVELR